MHTRHDSSEWDSDRTMHLDPVSTVLVALRGIHTVMEEGGERDDDRTMYLDPVSTV